MRRAFRRHASQRRLLVPDQWSGSVQEFYHFLLGYFAPLTLWLDRHPGRPCSVRDCGPMNSWFEVLPGGSDVEILNPGDMLHLFAARLRPTKVLKGMDNPTDFNSKLLQRFRDLLLTTQQVDLASSERRITVVDRLSSGSFNKTPAAEVPASGQAVRSTPNLSTLARKFLGSLETHPWVIVDAAKISPQQQLQTFASTSLLVAQHGAGLANMLWMPPGGTVVEIQPPRPTYEPPFFRNLAAACGHSYLRVSQQHDHAEVPEDEFRSAVWAALRKDAAS